MKGAKLTIDGVDWTITRVYEKSYQFTHPTSGERKPIPKDDVIIVGNVVTMKVDQGVADEETSKSHVDLNEKSTTLPQSEEENSRRGRPEDPNSKLARCYQIYLREHDKGRNHTMKVFTQELGISGNCGNTYFYKCKARAKQEGLERTGGQEVVGL